MDALPEQQLETVAFHRYRECFPDEFVPALLRHSEILRSILFKDVKTVGSVTLAEILRGCRGLETFWVTTIKEDRGNRPVALLLDHAIAQEWVCRNIKDLRFTIDMNYTKKQQGVEGAASDSQEADAIPREHWANLGSFYSQLGRLVELEVLELFVMRSKRKTEAYEYTHFYPGRTLTGLLSLEEEDRTTGKRGFLSLLAGLKKLRVVQGCFRSGTEETLQTFGQREVEWIVEQWPTLEVIELLPDRYKFLGGFQMLEHIAWLKEKKPSLQLCRREELGLQQLHLHSI